LKNGRPIAHFIGISISFPAYITFRTCRITGVGGLAKNLLRDFASQALAESSNREIADSAGVSGLSFNQKADHPCLRK
jgi:hypothetical protein